MLVNPIQHTPLPYDPARQVLSPPAPVEAPPQQQPATPPVQQGDTPQDKFQQGGSGGGGQQNGGSSQSDQAATAEQLRSAYLQLQQLQQEANEALIAGDASGARDAAQEAAQVAVTIQNLTGSSPGVGLGAIEVAAQQISAQDETTDTGGTSSSASGSSGTPGGSGASGGQTGSSGGGSATYGSSNAWSASAWGQAAAGTTGTSGVSGSGGTTGDAAGAIIDLARAGLGTAYEVVDTAASLPSHAAPDRDTINGYKQTVLAAMAGVEALAARVLGVSSSSSSGASVIDIKA